MKSKYRINRLNLWCTRLSVAISGALLAGCSLWHDDLPECPTGADVEFVYDYNVQRADMFNAHVGGVTVFVFDKQGRFITSKEDCNSSQATPLRRHDYRMHLDLPPGEYRLIAQAYQHGTQEIMNRPGAKFRTTALSQGDEITDLTTKLDRNASAVVENADLPLDTLWRSLAEAYVTVRDMEPASARISLVRDTKELHISLRQLDEPADIHADDFEVTVTSDNGLLAYDNSLLPDQTITYTPWKTWTTEFPESDGTAKTRQNNESQVVEQRTANMQLSLSRLVWRRADDNPAMLTIRNRKSGAVIAQINLPDCLAKGRNAFELENYSAQEFLDREYDYSLDFFLRGDKWVYARLGISVLGWSYHLQPTDL